MKRILLLILSFFIFSCDSDSDSDSGDCPSGIYDCANICNGNLVEDCNGLCGGSAILDCSGICNGDDAIEDGVCDCEDNPLTPSENSSISIWGDICSQYLDYVECESHGCQSVCGDEECPTPQNSEDLENNKNQFENCLTPPNSCYCDDNTFKGEWFNCHNECMVEKDCWGLCGGDALIDDCGDCSSPNDFNSGQDDCGVCDGGNADQDCAGTCGGSAVEDCFGECGGTAELDDCGVCDGPGDIYECGCSDILEGNCDCNGNVEDCAGICGGDAEKNCADICNGPVISDGCDLPENMLSLVNGSVLYNSTTDISGFQFNIEEGTTTLIGVSGGDAVDAGFTVSNSSTIVLGFSFTGSYIEAGCGVLTILEFDNENSGVNLDENSIVISNTQTDPAPEQIDFNYCSGE